MNSRVLVSFAPDSSLISFALPPEGARSPDLSPEPGRVPTRAGGGGGGIQHFPVDGCSAVSCDLGLLTGEDEHRSFYSAIFVLGSVLLTDYKSEVPMTSYLA